MAGLKAATMTTKRSGSPYDLVNIGNLLRRRAGSDCRRATIGLPVNNSNSIARWLAKQGVM